MIPLLKAANQLECEKAKYFISQYVFNKLNLKNNLFYFKLTKLFHLKLLNNYFCNYFLQQYLSRENVKLFYSLTIKDLVKTFSCSELQISSELELFNAAVDWINYKPKKRIKHMNKLLKLIRLPLLTDEILTSIIKNHEFCKNCVKCLYTINKAIKDKTSCTQKASNIQFLNRYYNCTFETNKIMVFKTAKTSKVSPSVYTIDEFNFKIPKTVSKMQQKTFISKSAVIGNKIYCLSYVEHNNFFEVYNRKKNSWSSLANFEGSWVEYCSVCSFMGKIYAFGDLYGNNWVYDPVENNWTQISGCNQRRESASCTVFQGQCVVIGGRNSSSNKNLKSVETYDHYLNKWSFLADMQNERCQAGVVTKGDKIFVIGGFFENTCEVYDSNSKRFCEIAKFEFHYNHYHYYDHHDMIIPLIFGDKIVVYGDKMVYIYDINTNQWSYIETMSTNDRQNFFYHFVKIHRFLSRKV